MSRTISGQTNIGVRLKNASDNPVTVNGSVVAPGAFGIYAEGPTVWELANVGLIKATGTKSSGVVLGSGGLVNNASTISGTYYGVNVKHASGTVTNTGTISSTYMAGGAGILLDSGGTITNGSAEVTTALITGGNAAAAYIKGGLGDKVVNHGTITGLGVNGSGVALWTGGTVLNGSPDNKAATIKADLNGVGILGGTGTVANNGTIVGQAARSWGVYLFNGGSVTNGSAGHSAALIGGAKYGVEIKGGPGTVTNEGTIKDGYGNFERNGDAVMLLNGGTVTNGILNGTAAVISGPGDWGVNIQGGVGTVVNKGVITGGGPNSDWLAGAFASGGIVLGQGGTIVNGRLGSIIGKRTGVLVQNGAGFVENDGKIDATGGRFTYSRGVEFLGGGTVVNGAGASISGGSAAITIGGGPGTVVNAGTIGNSVTFGAGFANQLTVSGGAVFKGSVDGGNAIGTAAVSTLSLANGPAPGIISGIGTQFTNFGILTVDPSATWTISGNIAGLASGQVIHNFLPDDKIQITGLNETVLDYTGGVLHLTGDQTISLNIPGKFSTAAFIATHDAVGTTISMLSAATPSTPDLSSLSDSGSSDIDNITRNTTPTLTGSADANASVTLFAGKTAIGTGTANASGLWSVVTSPLTDGTHQVTAQAYSISGLISLFSPTLTVTIDTTTPGNPGIPDLAASSDSGISANDNVTAIATAVFTGKSDAGAAVTLLDGVAIVGSGSANASGNWSIKSSTLSDGIHTITARTADLAGNISGPSPGLKIMIDTAVPAAASQPNMVPSSDTGLSSTDNITQSKTPTFNGNSEAGTTVTLFADGMAVGSAKATAAGTWSITSSLLTEAKYAFTAQATDAAGNVGVLSVALPITIDRSTAAPGTPDLSDASDTGASATDNITRVTTPEFSGKSEANAAIRLFDGATIVGTGKADTFGVWSIKTNALSNGTHTITARATDVAGNISPLSPGLKVTIDSTTPVAASQPNLSLASDSGASGVDNVTRVKTPTFTGTSEGGVTVTLLADGIAVGSAKSTASGYWSITTTTLADGARSIMAIATDSAGNLSIPSDSLLVTIDSSATAPSTPELAAASDSGASTTDSITRVTTPTFIGQSEAKATVTLFDGGAIIGTGKANASGAWSIKTSALASGTHTVTSQATDVAGNTSALSGGQKVVIDTTAPVAPGQPNLRFTSDSGRSSSDNVTSVKTLGFNGTTEAGVTVTLSIDGVAAGVAKSNSAGNWSIVAGPLADGKHAVSARAVDLAGNTSLSSIPLSVTIDSVAPGAPVVANVTTTSVSGTGEPGSVITLFDGLAKIGSTTASDTEHWSLPISLPAGNHPLTATASDIAGNTSATALVNAVIGTATADELSGSPGRDLMAGGLGDDIYHVDDPVDLITEAPGGGSDTILAHTDYTLGSSSRIEFLRADAGAPSVVLTGNGFANTVIGGSNDDVIAGGGGADILFGGLGADIFLFMALTDSPASPAGRDTIEDYQALSGDLIGLSGIDANSLLPGDQSFTFVGSGGFSGVAGHLLANVIGGTTLVSGDVNGDGTADFAIKLTGVQALSGANFIL